MYKKVLLSLLFLLASSNGFAQYYFGRNKIQYDHFEWKIMRTEHFDVYFYPEMQELAEIGAAFAEEAYSKFESKLNHNIPNRIPLIFYSNHSHFQQTNTIPSLIPEGVGGFFEFIKGRVVIPSNGNIHQFKHVIQHELVHVFVRSKMNRVLKDHRRTSYAGLPLWFTEGIAEYWAEGWDSQAEMVLRDAVLNDHLVPLSRMDLIYGTFLMYKEGQAICKYIAETFGEEKLQLLIDNVWKENEFSHVMKLTIGLDYKDFDQKWIYDLKKLYYPLLEDNDLPKMVTRTITKEGVNTKPVCYNQGGEDRVVFVSNRVGYSNVYIKSLRGESQDEYVLVKGERTSDFESFHLFNSKIDVNNRGELTFVTKSGESDVIYVYNIDERKIAKKFQFEDLVSLASPNWSPDNRQIAFSGISFAGLSDLYLVDVASGELQRLTNDFYYDHDPAWSPDGRVIAFSSDRSFHGRDGFINLFLYDVENGAIQYITKGEHNDYSPAWSPDGQSLAFASDRDGSFNLWMLKNVHGQPDELQLAETPSNGHSGLGINGENGRRQNGNGVKAIGENGHSENSGTEYPSSIAPEDQMKQLTNFTTAAFDPVWLSDDRIVFTAFENFSFQIRELSGVREKFETFTLVPNDTLVHSNELWAADKIAGDVESTTIKYKRKFSLDIAQSAISQDPVFGVSGGAQLAMSDMLGNQQYYFLLYNNAQVRSDFITSWNFAITRVELSRRANYAFGAYRLSGRFYDRIDSFFERSQVGGFVAASYPFSVFNRIEGSINVRKEKREYDFRGQTVDGILVSNSISYVKDNSIWGYTGPVDGERFNVTLGHTIDVQHNDVNYLSTIVDYRRYFRVNTSVTYATRVMGRFNLGRESFRYFMGGSWDLRLYPRWRIWGQKLFLVNQELRFPFIDRFLVGFPFGGLGLNAIRGAVFLDFGQAWDRDYEFNEVLGSLGFGLRLRIGGFLVLRYELGKRFQVSDLSNPHINFDEGIKKAFWFGFDF